MVLTDSKVKQSKSKAKDYKLSDGKGLFLLVTKAGAKYWRLKYRFLGKEKLIACILLPLSGIHSNPSNGQKVIRSKYCVQWSAIYSRMWAHCLLMI
jgi:hypothetical protein